MDHFSACKIYENKPLKKDWKIIFIDDNEKQVENAEVLLKRHFERENKIEEVGHDSDNGPNAPIIYCIRIRARGGICGKIWPEQSRGLRPYFTVYPDLSPNTNIIPFLTMI